MRSTVLSRIIVFGALLLATSNARSEAFRIDDEFLDLLVDETPSVEAALTNVNRVCRQEELAVRSVFNQERRQLNRSLESLGQNGVSRRRSLDRNVRRLNKELRHVRDECGDARRAVTRRFESIRSRQLLSNQNLVSKPRPVGVSPPVAIKPKARLSPPPVPPERVKPRATNPMLTVHGTLKNETAYRIDKPHKFTKNRVQASFEESLTLTPALRVKASQRAFFDTVANHFNEKRPVGSTSTDRNDLESEVELRELFLESSLGDVDIRAGKQVIVWGEAVAVFVADTVNGKDLREYILPEFDWIRRPQWSFDMTHTKDALTMEGLVSIPEFDKLGTRGSEFAFPLAEPSGAYLVHDEEKPDSSLSNADYGGRFGYLVGGLDVGLFFLHTWNKTPVIKREIRGGTLHLTPTHQRTDILGLTFSQDVGDSIFKGEAALRPNQPYSTSDPLSADGIDTNMTLDTAVGLDHAFGRLDTNIQVLQKFVADAGSLINEEASRTHISLWAKTELFRGRVMPEILAVMSLNRADHLYRPKVVFKVSDSVLLKTGVDIFDGANRGLFGIFEGKSRAYSEVEYHF